MKYIEYTYTHPTSVNKIRVYYQPQYEEFITKVSKQILSETKPEVLRI